MDDQQGKGLREWAEGLSATKRAKIASLGGKARAKKLSAKRRSEIASMGGKRKSLIHKAKTQDIK